MAPLPICKEENSSMFLDVQHVSIPREFWRLSAAVQIASSAVRYDWSVGLLYWGRWKCIIYWKFWVGVYCKGRFWVVKIASVELFRSAGFVVVKRGCHFSEACQRSRTASQPSWHFLTLMCVLRFLTVNSKLKNKDSLCYEASCALREVSIFFFLFFLFLVITNVCICERNTLIFLSFIHSALSFIHSSFFSFLLSWSWRARTNLCSVFQSRGRDSVY